MGRSFLRHAAVYGFGQAVLYLGSFVLLPLYTVFLTPSEFGLIEVLSRLSEIATLCLLYNAFRQAVITLHNQCERESDRHCLIGTVLLLLSVQAVVGIVASYFLARPLGSLFGVQDAFLVFVAISCAMLEGTIVVLLGLLQARAESTLFVAINIAQLAVRVLLCFYLVAVVRLGVLGAFCGLSVTYSIFLVTLAARELKRAGLVFSLPILRDLITFSLPFLPGGLCLFVLNSGDRFILLYYFDKETVGTYALGYKVAMVVNTFSVTPLLMVWSSRMYDAAKQSDAPVVFGQVVTRILWAQALVGLGACIFQDEIVALLAGPAYASAAYVIAPIVLAYWFLAAVSLMDAPFYLRRRTGLKTCVTVAATVIVLFLYGVLIPRYGAAGAALATLLGFFFQCVLTRIASLRVFFIHCEYCRLVMLLTAAVGCWLVSRMISSGPSLSGGTLALTVPESWYCFVLKLIIWFCYPLFCWVTGIISPSEKDCILDIASSVAKPVLSLFTGRCNDASLPLPRPHGGRSSAGCGSDKIAKRLGRFVP